MHSVIMPNVMAPVVRGSMTTPPLLYKINCSLPPFYSRNGPLSCILTWVDDAVLITDTKLMDLGWFCSINLLIIFGLTLGGTGNLCTFLDKWVGYQCCHGSYIKVPGKSTYTFSAERLRISAPCQASVVEASRRKAEICWRWAENIYVDLPWPLHQGLHSEHFIFIVTYEQAQ